MTPGPSLVCSGLLRSNWKNDGLTEAASRTATTELSFRMRQLTLRTGRSQALPVALPDGHLTGELMEIISDTSLSVLPRGR